MCLGIPMKIIEKTENTGIVEQDGVKREVGLMLIENAKIGDWVIIHAGFAISRLNEQEAAETLELLREGGFIE